jgi:hypothetical protein
MSKLRETIEAAFEERTRFTPDDTPGEIRQAVAEAIDALDDGPCPRGRKDRRRAGRSMSG